MSTETHEQLDATNSLVNVIETGDTEEVAMILGHKEKIRCAGIVRPGIKVLKKGAKPEEIAKFKQMEAEGYGYDQIDIALGGKPKTATSRLFPSNSDYFVVRDCDFKKPGDAQFIRKNYADPDGKVRRFPVWFTQGQIDRVMPHGFKAFDGNGHVRCFSFYNDAGDLCFRYVPKAVANPKKGLVAEGGDWLILDSDDEDAASKACGYKVSFGGMYRVNVKGLRGLEEVIIPTKSWHGLGYSVATLRRVRSILGRFDGLVNGAPFFELCKVQEEVTTPDGKKQDQWLVTLELSVDPIELAQYAEPTAVAARASRAMQMFSGAPAPAPVAPAAPAPGPLSDLPAELGTGEAEAEAVEQVSGRRVKLMDYLAKAAKAIGLTVDQMHLFIEKQRGPVGTLSEDILAEVCESVRLSIKNGAEGFKADLLASLEQ